MRHFDALHTLLDRLQALIGTRLVDDIDSLVRHMTVVDVTRGQFGSRAQGLITVFDIVMAFETPLQAAQNANGVFHRRLRHIDLLETPGQGTVLLEDAAEFLEGG
ncbi:hypothetical protein D3C81_1329000 [compost metagenome]